MAEGAGGLRPSRGSASRRRTSRSACAVAAQRRPDRRGRRVERRSSSIASSLAQVGRHLAAQRLGDALRGRLADRRSASAACRPRPARRGRRRGRSSSDAGRGAERLDLERRLVRPLEQERDLPQVGGRVAGVRHAASTVVDAWQAGTVSADGRAAARGCATRRSGASSRRPAGWPPRASPAWTTSCRGSASCPPTSGPG